MTAKRKKLDRAANALLGMKEVRHERPTKPTKGDLDRRFKMKIDRKGNPSIVEVE